MQGASHGRRCFGRIGRSDEFNCPEAWCIRERVPSDRTGGVTPSVPLSLHDGAVA